MTTSGISKDWEMLVVQSCMGASDLGWSGVPLVTDKTGRDKGHNKISPDGLKADSDVDLKLRIFKNS